jgi:hypothetical protein
MKKSSESKMLLMDKLEAGSPVLEFLVIFMNTVMLTELEEKHKREKISRYNQNISISFFRRSG